MQKMRTLAIIAALLGLNDVLAFEARADEDITTRWKCKYQQHPETGTWGEYCLTTCYTCHCGGECD